MEDWKYGNRKTTGCPTKTFGHDRRCGFTLVELVITIAIVIILSVISVPIYRGYVDKAKLAEGYALLGAILSAQKAYYSEYGNFYKSTVEGTSYEPALGVDVRGNKYFTSFWAGWGSEQPNVESAFFALTYIPKDLVPGKHRLAIMHDLERGDSRSRIYFYD